MGRAIAQTLAGFSLQRPGFTARSVHVGFVIDKMELGQVFLKVLLFFPVSIITLLLHTHACNI
jgi:hypothetical protein